MTGCSLHSDIFPALENTKKYRFIEVDIRNEASVKELFKAICPDVVINCSALSVPDYCETHHEEAYLINVTAVEQLAHLCKEYQSRFIHLSTDFVFDGKINERTGQLYTEEILPAPVNYYGFTKWKGEEKVADICIYFASNMATTAFGALNTLLIGAFLPATEVAYWSVCMQLIGAVQTMYTPIIDGVYPEMIRKKSWDFIKHLLMIFMPIVFAGSAFSIVVAPYVLQIVGGKQYVAATPLFRLLVPVLIFSFPAVVLGWPTLGALNKAAQVTKTTILAAVVQVVSLLLLIATGHFTVMWIAIFRCVTEFVLMTCRGWYCWKYRKEFC